ncbi:MULTISPECIES: hypothetical protein [unclassified Massilia]|uniref:hypothetical protein n=1 Tax=unclassified Massilia TaxID=2609279 RepID=UPI00177AC9FA|nr:MULTISPECIES: hypothetical protein [unclassified Massilia]MBD8530737.1 hypothetical protein [Massilia sp. CFBP 13647]MBD8676463.1 hypothetical protein [Massilia sp. CFBP 13721]
MSIVKLDELEGAAMMVEDGGGTVTAMVSRATGMIHFLNDEYADEEAPVPSASGANGDYVPVPAAGTLGIGDGLILRFAATHMAGDQETVRDLFRDRNTEGFARLLEERSAGEAWEQFHEDATRTALQQWCTENGLQLAE